MNMHTTKVIFGFGPLSAIMRLGTAIIAFQTSVGFWATFGWTLLALLFWPVFITIWIVRLLLPALRAHGIV